MVAFAAVLMVGLGHVGLPAEDAARIVCEAQGFVCDTDCDPPGFSAFAFELDLEIGRTCDAPHAADPGVHPPLLRAVRNLWRWSNDLVRDGRPPAAASLPVREIPPTAIVGVPGLGFFARAGAVPLSLGDPDSAYPPQPPEPPPRG